MVTGKKSFSLCGAKAILEPLLSPYRVYRFYDFRENPRLQDVKRGISMFRRGGFDFVVAIGGGSVLDTAKLINIFAHQTGSIETHLKERRIIVNKGKPLVAIPTTAGTGSESTHFAVLYKNKIKYSVAHDYLLPTVDIIDPQFTLNLTPVLTATTGMDALSQAIESYWSLHSTAESKRYAQIAIKLIMANLKNAVQKPSRESRKAMARAAHLSGKAINITKTTAPHALSYIMTSYFGVKHGHAVGLTLPEILVYNAGANKKDVADKRGIAYVKKTISHLNDLLKSRDAYESRRKLKELMNNIGLATRLSAVGIKTQKDINLILRNVNIERLKNNPRVVASDALRDILINLI